jgi:hypothetical protein
MATAGVTAGKIINFCVAAMSYLFRSLLDGLKSLK